MTVHRGLVEGPSTPDEDEFFGAEGDDPRAVAPFESAYEVDDFDPVHEYAGHDLHDLEDRFVADDEGLVP